MSRQSQRRGSKYQKKQAALEKALASFERLTLQEEGLRYEKQYKTIQEQILLELIETQETAHELLHNRWRPLLEQHTQQQQQQPQPQPQQQQCLRSRLAALRATSSTAAISGSSHAVRTNDVEQLLREATPEEVLFVVESTSQDWREWFNDIVMRHMALLELLHKPWLGGSLPPAAVAAAVAIEPSAAAAALNFHSITAAGASAHPQASAAAAAATGASSSDPSLHIPGWGAGAAAAASVAAAVSVGPSSTPGVAEGSTCFDPSLPACNAAGAAAAGAAGAGAAAAAGGGPVDSAGQPLLPPAVIWRNLEADYDQWVKLCSIGFLVNPNTLVAAGSTHFVTGQVDAPPAEHWREVVRRMRLTDTQLLHIKAVSSLLKRIDKAVEHDMDAHMSSRLHRAAQAAPLLQMAYGHGAMFGSSTAAGDGQSAAVAATAAAAAGTGGRNSAAAAATGAEGETPTATQQPGSSSGRVTSTAAKAAIVTAAAAAAWETLDADSDESSGGDIGLLLHRALRHKLLNMVAVTWVQCCTVSKLQACIGQVASWPYGPMSVSIAAAAMEELEERQQQHLQRRKQAVSVSVRRKWDLLPRSRGSLNNKQQEPEEQEQEEQQEQQDQQQQQQQQECCSSSRFSIAPASALDDLVDRHVEAYMSLRQQELLARQQQWWQARNLQNHNQQLLLQQLLEQQQYQDQQQ